MKTVGELAADRTWVETHIAFRLAGLKIWWEQATYSRTVETVRLSRIVTAAGGKTKRVNRYVPPWYCVSQMKGRL